MKPWTPYLRLARPANIITAVADILAGFAVSGAALLFLSQGSGSEMLLKALLWLCLSTIGLYGGGVVLNDVFDADLDRVERPERPIPSGAVSVNRAAMFGFILLLVGILAAWQVSRTSGEIALGIAFLSVLYDAWGKHQLVFGPLNMGLCRAGNLLLGVSAIPGMVWEVWYTGFIPLVYIAAITMISRGEVHGKNKAALQAGLGMYVVIILVILGLSFTTPIAWFQVLPFLLLLVYLIFPPLLKALKTQQPQLIGKAVKAGVISLIVLNSALASAYAGWLSGILILILLPLSLWMGKKFAVT